MASRSCSLPLAFPGSLMTPSERSSSSSRGHAPESVSKRLRTAQLVLIRAPVLRRTISVRRESNSSVGWVSTHSRLMIVCSRFVPAPELAEGANAESVGLGVTDDGTGVLAPSAATGSSNRDNGLGFIDCWSGLANLHLTRSRLGRWGPVVTAREGSLAGFWTGERAPGPCARHQAA